jgi:hypothetical protein
MLHKYNSIKDSDKSKENNQVLDII